MQEVEHAPNVPWRLWVVVEPPQGTGLKPFNPPKDIRRSSDYGPESTMFLKQIGVTIGNESSMCLRYVDIFVGFYPPLTFLAEGFIFFFRYGVGFHPQTSRNGQGIG